MVSFQDFNKDKDKIKQKIIHPMANGGKTMKKSQKINAKVGLGLLMVAALVLAILSTQAWAEVNCNASPSNAADSDNDGFKDAEECNGIPVYHSADPVFLNPNKQDLFVILVRATDLGASDTNIPEESDPGYFDPLEFVSNPIAAGGLEFTTHLIPYSEANPDRFVSTEPSITQKAVRITENLHPEGIILGYANQGTPNGLDDAIIYTEHIKDHVESVCAEGTTYCKYIAPDGTEVNGANAIIPIYIMHTIAHEVGHMTDLAVDYNRRFGGYHYKAGSKVVMEQAVKYTSKKGKVTFYISTQYAGPSQQGVQLQ
jgi:hypothetical protein